MTSAPVFESRFPVGSSARITRGSTDERAGDRDALLLAARELARQVLGAVGEADLAEQRARAVAQLVAAGARSGASAELDVLERGERRDQVELLEDEAERAQPQLGELAVAAAFARSRPSKRTCAAASAGRARRGAGAASSCPTRSGPRARRTRPPRS